MRRAEGRWPYTRNTAYIALLCAALLVFQVGFRSGDAYIGLPLDDVLGDAHKPLKTHPIARYTELAHRRFDAKRNRQSKTLRGAVDEYKRRYHRNPPRGFDKWWQYAQEANFVMVDEFDGLMEDFAPFWNMSGEEVARRAKLAADLPSMDYISIRDGEAIDNTDHDGPEGGARGRQFLNMLSDFAHELPDLDFAINALAEGRVVVPWEHINFPNSTDQDSSDGIDAIDGKGDFTPDWKGDGSVWEIWRRSCPPSSPARRILANRINPFAAPIDYLQPELEGRGRDFYFAMSVPSRLDFCQHPQAHYTQGHFFSDWRTIPALFPIFSPARARGFSDIRIPSHYYYRSSQQYTYGWNFETKEVDDVDPMEVPWDEKTDLIFWRGSTTGGGSTPPGHVASYQRHRFLRMTSDGSDTLRAVTFEEPSGSSQWVTAEVKAGLLNEELTDVAFTSATHKVFPGGLEALFAEHRFGDPVPLGAHWSHKYLADLDGMGYSGRFMAFLESNSVPVKASMYKEFYSDWIEPWVHFIPLSTSYRELYNIHAYYSGPSEATMEAYKASLVSDEDEDEASTERADGAESEEGAGEAQMVYDDASRVGRWPPPAGPRNPEGDAKLRRIARAGREWKKTMGRRVDMEVYVFRMCLEYARLCTADREAMDFMG
ncbi:glycosyltransferase family 90 protein [Schizophyllum fasciatum]